MIIKKTENIYANIKEQNVLRFSELSGIKKCYAVTFTIESTYTLFGNVIKTVRKEEIIPFVFKSLEVAKDYCKIHPKIFLDVFVNNECIPIPVKYVTFRLLKNNKIIGYIKWDDDYVFNADYEWGKPIENIRFERCITDPIVDKFVEDINIKRRVAYTCNVKDIDFENPCDTLSELGEKILTNKSRYKKVTFNEWNFKLVEA